MERGWGLQSHLLGEDDGDDVTSGDITDHLYDWLVTDLAQNRGDRLFVFGHEPAFPQPDADNGRLRHRGDSLDRFPQHRDRFWNLLREEELVAYICGHTHNTSVVAIDGVWQMDVGHARGMGDQDARSTFLIIQIDGEVVNYWMYRDDA